MSVHKLWPLHFLDVLLFIYCLIAHDKYRNRWVIEALLAHPCLLKHTSRFPSPLFFSVSPPFSLQNAFKSRHPFSEPQDSIFRTHLFEEFLIWRHWKVAPTVKSSITPGREIVAWFVICYFPCCGDCLSVPGLSLRPSLIGDHCLSKPPATLRAAFVVPDKWGWPLTIK